MVEASEQTDSQDTQSSGMSLMQKAIWTVVGVILLGFLFRDFLWAVVQSMMLNVVPLLFTPIVLELAVAFAGLFIVLLFCHFRSKEHENEWVTFPQAEIDAAMNSSRSPDINLDKKPAAAAEKKFVMSESNLEELENWIAAGELEAAEKELGDFSENEKRDPKVVVLQLRLLLQRKDWTAGEALIAKGAASREKLALGCVEAARVFVKQKPRDNDAARRCLDLGKGLSVNAVVNAIDSEGRLQKLA